MTIIKSVFLIVFMFFMSFTSCKAQSQFKGHRKKKTHHHGFFSSNDKATRKNEKMKKKIELCKLNNFNLFVSVDYLEIIEKIKILLNE